MLNGDGSTRTITIPDRSKYAGVRTIDKNDGSTLTVNRAAPVVTSDRAGESRPLLSKLVGGAAAAYSLRDLNDKAGNSKVVRVRRASDNHEKDFRAKEVKDIAAWVNTQTTLPLDIQELEADGRTGDVIEAAAAYSLRNLSSSYTGNVVDVRRSSDDAEESFTADEVADGTLTDWVNTDVVKFSSDFSSSLNGFIVDASDTALAGQTFEGESGVMKHIPSTLSASHRVRRLSTIPRSSIVSLKVLVYIPSANTVANGAQMRNAAGELIAATSTTDEWVEIEATGTTGSDGSSGTFAIHATSGGDRLFTGNGTDAIYYKNVSVTVTSADGFVSKWYDQSGNDNHATQGTEASQPKIVDGGTLVSGGMRFDDNQFLQTTNTFTYGSGTTLSTFLVNSSDGDENAYLFRFAANYIVWNAIDGTRKVSAGANANAGKVTGDEELWTTISELNTAGGTSNFYVDGTLAAAADAPIGTNVVSPARKLNIGGSGVTSHWNGTVNEIIFYDSDQSDNRTAIEANIVDHYGIDLPSGVDTGYDQVDGFVETWYDQSGNGNDAIQTVAANQPKIVDAGTYLGYLTKGVAESGFSSGLSVALTDEFSLFYRVNLSAASSILGASGTIPRIRHYPNQIELRNAGADEINFNETGLGTANAVYALLRDSSNSVSVFKSSSQIGTPLTLAGAMSFNHLALRTTNQDGIEGRFYEIIIYNSDQSANREAIEANINNQYDVY